MGVVDPGKFRSHDIELDPEMNADESVGGRGTERATRGPIIAIKSFFETQQEIQDLRKGERALYQVVKNEMIAWNEETLNLNICLLYTSPSPRDATLSRMPSSA